MDLCHRDGSLKREVAENPAKYIHEVRCSCSGLPCSHNTFDSFSSLATFPTPCFAMIEVAGSNVQARDEGA